MAKLEHGIQETSPTLLFGVARLDFHPGIFQEFKDTNAKYKQRIRSRVSNLRDAKNPLLKLKVLSGQISPDKFATMPTEVPSE